MIIRFLVFISFAFTAMAFKFEDYSEALIQRVNNKQTTWKAGRNFHGNTPKAYIKRLMGVLPETPQLTLTVMQHNETVIKDLPETLDLREEWPNCPTLKEIRDQGSCGSCWAIAAAEAMSDRVCIHSNGSRTFHFSAENLMSCCADCGHGCLGGHPAPAWDYWVRHGIVSGGLYNSHEGCQPYKIPPCEHSTPGGRPGCFGVARTPKCTPSCIGSYNVSYNEDKRYGERAYTITGEDHIKAEVLKNGPVEAVFMVFEDFIAYKSGVYKHVEGSLLGLHACKIIGWGVENGTKFWLAANSWNTDWGDEGFFRIIAGENHCGIEDTVIAGLPRVD